jgi:alcohol dehydrogenase class IV
VGQLLTDETGRSPAYYIDLLVNTLESWTQALEMSRLGHYGLQSQDVEEILDAAKNRNNPITLTRSEIRTLVESRL